MIKLDVDSVVDAPTAAKGIAHRRGLGKVRRLETNQLWIQEKVRTRQIILKKVKGDVNPADLLTKHLGSKDKVDQLVSLYGCAFMSGRAKSAPLLKRRGATENLGTARQAADGAQSDSSPRNSNFPKSTY